MDFFKPVFVILKTYLDLDFYRKGWKKIVGENSLFFKFLITVTGIRYSEHEKITL